MEKFDERQQYYRGKVAQEALTITWSLMFLDILVNYTYGSWTSNFQNYLLFFFITMYYMAVRLLSYDAALPNNGSDKHVYFGMAIGGILLFIQSIILFFVTRFTIIENGILTSTFINLLSAILPFIYAIYFIYIKVKKSRRCQSEED